MFSTSFSSAFVHPRAPTKKRLKARSGSFWDAAATVKVEVRAPSPEAAPRGPEYRAFWGGGLARAVTAVTARWVPPREQDASSRSPWGGPLAPRQLGISSRWVGAKPVDAGAHAAWGRGGMPLQLLGTFPWVAAALRDLGVSAPWGRYPARPGLTLLAPWVGSLRVNPELAAPWERYNLALNPGWGIVTDSTGAPATIGAIVTLPKLDFYMLNNDAVLRRVDNNTIIQAPSIRLSLDVDSWTWTFGAEIDPRQLDAIQRVDPIIPVELEVTINGYSVRVIAEGVAFERTASTADLSITGRGINAILDDPYSPIMTFGNQAARTMQQLSLDALMLNGVSNGWGVDWHPVDWAVPAGCWSHQGTYASAISALAQGAGAYAQPHPTLSTIRVLPRFPSLPWTWNTAIPDFELPSSAVTVEGLKWNSLPEYNRVYVRGESGGVDVCATRLGSAGGMPAPPIVDSLITSVAGARARAEAVLAATGGQLLICLRLPIFQDMGLILPGSLVRYVDNGLQRVGISRAISVDITPEESWQTIEVESYA